MTQFIRLCLLTSLLGVTAIAATPGTGKWLVNLDQGTGQVDFNAIGRPSMLKIHGKGSAPKGSLVVEGSQVSGALTFDLESLNTGIQLRDEHMKKKYLETPKFAQATLTLTKLEVPATLKVDGSKVEKMPFQGSLLLHGVQKPVSGFATVTKTDSQMIVSADFGIKITDFGIEKPGYLGITLAEDVQVTVQSSAPIVIQQ